MQRPLPTPTCPHGSRVFCRRSTSSELPLSLHSAPALVLPATGPPQRHSSCRDVSFKEGHLAAHDEIRFSPVLLTMWGSQLFGWKRTLKGKSRFCGRLLKGGAKMSPASGGRNTGQSLLGDRVVLWCQSGRESSDRTSPPGMLCPLPWLSERVHSETPVCLKAPNLHHMQ